ncbi:MAG: hypothetical protein GY715_03495 [Planctomycetes bacterium]|nr:hypothetical protein [Planctomycetota bacterium]
MNASVVDGPCRRASTVFAAVIIAALGLAGFADASFTSAAARGTTVFDCQDPDHQGQTLTETERSAVTAAIDVLATIAESEVPGIGACVDELRGLLENHRIASEAGVSTNVTTTLPDGFVGGNAMAEAIHVHADFTSWPVQVQAAALAHAWRHAAQTDFSGAFEAACLQWEFDCLVALGQDAAGQPGRPRHDLVAKALAAQQTAPTTPPSGAGRPTAGGVIRQHQGAQYAVFSDAGDPNLYILPPGLGETFTHALSMEVPYNLVVFETGGRTYVIVSGFNASTSTGVLQAFRVLGNGSTLQAVYTTPYPGKQPFSLALSPTTGRLYMLCCSCNVIWILDDLEPAGSPDGVPDTLVTFFSDTALGDALAIALDTFAGHAGDSLFVDDRDTRGRCAVVVGDGRVVHSDTDGDGDADTYTTGFSWRDHVAVVPGYTARPAVDDTLVDVFGGAGVDVEVHVVDGDGVPLEHVGSATVAPTKNTATVMLSRPLARCERIRAFDLDHAWTAPPFVQPVAIDGDVNDDRDVGFADILAVIGAWGPCAGCPADVDDSGDVGFADILAVIGAWGSCPP